MDADQLPAGCADRSCAGDCERANLSRRTFLALSATGIGALAVPGQAAALLEPPAPHTLSPEAVAALFDRGAPTEYTGAALPKIGMPVGGGTCGQVFLAGDGRLWAWDIFNPIAFPLGGANFSGANYANPLSADRPGAQQFGQGFALRTTNEGRTSTRRLDATGFAGVTFTGQYPVGTVEYADPGSPVQVSLSAFSPFIPLATADSTIPATVMAYTVRNTSAGEVTGSLLGYAENPVCLNTKRQMPTTLKSGQFGRGIEFTAADDHSADQDDIVFEDWESDSYEGWTVTGDAFGEGPVQPWAVPRLVKRFGDLNVSGTRFVTSYNFRLSGEPDRRTGTLTSREFTIERRYVAVGVSGGNQPGKACVNVVVDGQVVATATGDQTEPLVSRMLDVGAHLGKKARIQIVDTSTLAWGHISCDAIVFTDRPDILFEAWEKTTYAGWTVQGTAFGAGPVLPSETPEAFRRPFGGRTELNVTGRFVTSYNFRAGTGPDGHQGKLISREFTIERRFVTAWVGGGSHRGQTCLNVVVDGAVVASATGTDIEPLNAVSMDVGPWAGRTARIEIVDAHTGGWGHVNVDRILFSDRPIRRLPVAERPDGGSFALASLSDNPKVRPSIARWATPDDLFDAPDGPAEAPGNGSGQAGTVAVPFTLAPGESATLRFVFGWYFPTPSRETFSGLVDGPTLRRFYGTRFGSAREVTEHVAEHADRLEQGTKTWVQTWYDDSTLPHWFLERTLATASTLATSTCFQWSNGRFYAWEGTYCCSGTCQHVWNYAQAIGRLFPDLERDTRERVDLGIAFRPTGEIGNRGEVADAASSFADGQCGTVLRFYREHQMSPDDSFLTRNWPKIKQATEFLVTSRDGADQDGIFRGSQWNTLDTQWFGEIPWISGLYVASLRAAAAMATEAGDTAAATRYTTIATRGTTYISSQLWNATYGYYIHKTDPAHPASMNTNRGCHIDQLYGQTYAAQLGLPRVFPADKSRTALGKIYQHNFLANPPAHRPPGVNPGARVYAMTNEPGVVMTTWPHGGSQTCGGLRYFNEVWTGQEHQLAAGLLAEGMVTEGLAVERAIYDRYHGTKRNPYNEVEASDHYARGMMSYGAYLAATGFEYHGPKGHLGFAPRIQPEDFRCAFTAAEGWGLYRQRLDGSRLTAAVEVRYGEVRLATLSFQTAKPAKNVTVRHGRRRQAAKVVASGNRVLVTLPTAVTVPAGQTLEVGLS